MTQEKHFNDIGVEIVDDSETYAKLIAETFNKYGSDKSSIHNYEIVVPSFDIIYEKDR